MNIQEVINFEDFCMLDAVTYTYRYTDREIQERTYYPVRIPEEILRSFYNEISSMNLTSIMIDTLEKEDKTIGTVLHLYSTVLGETDESKVRKSINFKPTFDYLLNSKYPIFSLNTYRIHTNNQILTAFITNTFPSLSSFPFKNDIETMIDLRNLTEDQWNHIIAPNITLINFSKNRISITFKKPIITLMEGI